MGDDRPLPGGRLEYAVLAAVWEGGAVTARDVHQRVGVPMGLVYTTTARVLDRLHVKGLVVRDKNDKQDTHANDKKDGSGQTGKAFRYRATVPRPEIDRARMSKTLAGLLTGRPRPALAALAEAIESLDPALLDELARAVETLRRSRDEP